MLYTWILCDWETVYATMLPVTRTTLGWSSDWIDWCRVTVGCKRSYMRMIQTNATVDGRNPAPVDMVNNIPLFKGFSTINSTTNNHIGWIPPKLYESKLRISLQLLTPNVFCGVPLFCITLNIYNYNACWSQ